MNNQQFRRLLIDNSKAPSSSPGSTGKNGAAHQGPGATPALGSRARSSIPMTPRNVGGSASELFARQLREQQDANKGAQSKVRSSAAPKGSKLAAGYTDRAQLRNEDTPEDDKAARIKALEEMVKLGQMEEADFQRARDQIIGGDIKNVHLVKGLDYRLLARARAGEDVYNTPATSEGGGEEAKHDEDVDELLDNLENAEVKPVQREERVKQGNMAAPPVPAAGKKRTRDDILREMKEARARAAAEQQVAQPVLGAHFKKIGPKNMPGTSRIEIDDQGREILIVVDAQGNVKRKIKKQKGDAPDGSAAMLMPDKDAKPLGMEVPENLKKAPLPEDEESEDIFADAGSDYNPLGDVEDDESDSGNSEEGGEAKDEPKGKRRTPAEAATSIEKSHDDGAPGKPRNYFGNEMETSSAVHEHSNPMHDPSILNALKRASASKAAEAASQASDNSDLEQARLARMHARLAEQDRDAEDMDMGFGSSRFEDAEEGDERPVKLAKWSGIPDDNDKDDEHTGRGGQGQRKRGKKKKKGDKNDVGTVLGVIEGRKG